MKLDCVKVCPSGGRFKGRIKKGFSLIEVVLALGVFSISILSITGLMATGLSSAKGSSTNLAVTNIMRGLRANVQSMPFSNLSRTGSPITYYYSADGYQTTTVSEAGQGPHAGDAIQPERPVLPRREIRTRYVPPARVGDEPVRMQCAFAAPAVSGCVPHRDRPVMAHRVGDREQNRGIREGGLAGRGREGKGAEHGVEP